MSKATGKLITDIKVNKKTVTIKFNEGKMSISHEAYSSAYLYVGKLLTSSDIKKLKEVDSLTKGLNYALSALKRRVMSSFEITALLKKKGISDTAIKKILKQLKEYDLINDLAYMEDLFEYYNSLNYGEYKIKDKLRQKGFNDEQISKIGFHHLREKQKALKMLHRFEERYERLPYAKRRESIYRSLANYGFSKENIEYVLASMKKDTVKKINETIKLDYMKALRLYDSKFEGRELDQKIYLYLRKKGYTSVSIKKYMEDKYHEID